MEKKDWILGLEDEIDELITDEEIFGKVRLIIRKRIEQELDKAREEGYKAMLEGLDNIARDSSGGFYKGVAIIKLRNEIARLYKLKDNK